MPKQYGPDYQSARCSVCHHPSRPEIDRDLLDGLPYRTLAVKYGLSASALCRHTKHLRHQIMLQERQAQQDQVTRFLEKLELLEARLERLFRHAEESHSLHVSLGCLQESLRLLSLQEKVRYSLRDPR